MRKPAPRSENSRIAASRLRAISESTVSGGTQQVGVGAAVGAADAAAQLVELGEAVAVGAVDEEGVGARDVEAVLDDRGRDQHVGAALDEGEHRPLELGLGHLAVRHRDPRLGHQPLHQARQRVDRLDAVVHEEDLARRAPAPGGWRRRSRRSRT